ncbi:hypothetical protein [Leptospira sp. GIMC2001]|uniref:hypothetical protein n=1 Tax=Leptospira sp. GIMC2001 TaxID=1513297 RepID=UPI00234ACD31|nr:hypothetical protein [Leptospira sp. GIMC2001]WCL48107.1 hypothetical protein O4O04_12365 [Leptospira sp. GIMC2001]
MIKEIKQEKLTIKDISKYSIVFSLAIILFFVSNCNKDYEVREVRDRTVVEANNYILSILNLYLLSSLTSGFGFGNYDYNGSVTRTLNVDGIEEEVCIDIYKINNLEGTDPDKIITGFENDPVVTKCSKQRSQDFLCLTDLTIYASFYYFKKSVNENSSIFPYCKDTLKGIMVL